MNKEQRTKNNDREMSKLLLITHFSLLIALFSLFVFSCPDPVTPPHENQLPKGYGSFTARLANDPERTIMPSTPRLTDLAVIELAFIPTSDGEALTVDKSPPASGNVLSPVILAVGTYDLTVRAYRDGGKTRLVAMKTETGIVITAGANVNGDIKLSSVFNGGTQGTFKWNITLNTGSVTVTSAAMTIKDSNGDQQGVLVDLLSANPGNRDLDPGLYTVVFNLTDNSGTRTVVWNEILHIYSALDSEFNFDFSDEYFTKTHWDVTFDPNYENGGGVIQSVLHGITASTITPVRTGFVFIDWYAEPECITIWNFDTIITESITLYAKWKVSYGLTLTFEEIKEQAPNLPIPAISHKGAGGLDKTTPVSVSTPAQYESITWVIPKYDKDGFTLKTGSSITLDSKDFMVGMHYITLEVYVKVNNVLVPYSRTIAFEVKP